MTEIDRQTWIILAERLDTIKRLREEAEAHELDEVLVFDSDDQARAEAHELDEVLVFDSDDQARVVSK